MKLLFLFCWLAFVLPAPYPATTLNATEQRSTVKNGTETYRTFQPSKIKKQKRKIRRRLGAAGWLIILLSVALTVGMIALIVHLWPAAAVLWRIVMVWLGLSLAIIFLYVGVAGSLYGRQPDRKLHNKAVVRLEKLNKKLNFTPEKTWCFPDEYYRLSVAADKNSLLIVDYQQDKGWIIPKENILEIKTDTVTVERAETLYPSGEGMESILIRRKVRESLPPYPPAKPLGAMQVLMLSCQDLPLRRMTLVYHPSAFGDNVQMITADLRTLWSIR